MHLDYSFWVLYFPEYQSVANLTSCESMPQAPCFRSSVVPEKGTLINTVMTDQINNDHWAIKSAREVLK